jgi:hypothetical protein
MWWSGSLSFSTYPPSSILKRQNATFRELDLFPSSGVGQGALTGLGHHSINGPVQCWDFLFLTDPTELVPPAPYLRTRTDPVPEKFCFNVLKVMEDGWSPKTQQSYLLYTMDWCGDVRGTDWHTVTQDTDSLAGQVSVRRRISGNS